FVTEIVVSTANLLPSATGQWHFGFEADGATLDIPLCWEELGTESAIDNFGFASSHEGARVCRLENLPDAYGTRAILSATCTVKAGQNYSVDVWVYLSSGTGVAGDVKLRLGIKWYDSADAFLSEDLSADLTVSAVDTWEKLSYINVIAPANATGGRLLVDAYESNNPNYDPYVDDASFHVTGNIAPNAPVLSSPADNAATNDTSPVFTWTFSDPNPGDTSSAYQWVADDNSAFSSINYNSGKTVTSYSSHTLTMAAGTWYWKVKTWDQDNVEGAYASYRTLKIDTTPPGAVINLVASSAGSNIEITWTPAGDSDIDHQVLFRATFTITNQYAANVTVLSNFLGAAAGSYTDPAVNFGTTYWYVVTAWDEATNESGISNCDDATPATIGDPRLAGTDYYCEPLFTPGVKDDNKHPYVNKRLCELIDSAQTRCYIAIYNLTDIGPAGNSITKSLIARAAAIGAANVKVVTDGANNATIAISSLTAAGITVASDGSNALLMHNKFAVIDGKYVWTGSGDWLSADSFDKQNSDGIIIYDEAVARAYEDFFIDMFGGGFHTASTRKGSKVVVGNNVEFYFTGNNAIKDAASFGLRYKVQNAAESCIGAIRIFEEADDVSLEEDLKAARSGGRVVRIVFDREKIPASSSYSYLDELGMNVRPLTGVNSKLMVIDQEIVAAGSMDWRTSSGGDASIPRHDENYLFIRDDILARQYVRYLMRLYDLTLDENTTENSTADKEAPSPVSNVSAFGSDSGQITVEFDASTDPNFSRYYIFISTLQNYANAMAVKQKFITTGQTNLSDARDNDGDKAVDEEIFNGVDDDADGQIDEDINMLAEEVVKDKGEGTVQVTLTTYAHGRALDNNTTYWVCVLQTDKSGNESEASFADASEPTAGDSFYGPVLPGVPVPNTAPECVVVSPSVWQGGSFGISATAWDNDNAYADSVISVEFQYSTASASGPWFYVGTKYLDTPASSTGTYIFTWPSASYITLDSTVWIRAYAKDKNVHKYSLPSVSGSFGVDNKAPSAPSPDDGIAASGSNWTNNSNPTMNWAAVTDPGSGLHATESYLVHYDTAADAAQTANSYAKTLADGSHIFYAAAKDKVGNISAYGNHSINIDATQPPATIVSDPAREFDRITIEWNSVTDVTSGVQHYNVYRDVSVIDTEAKKDALTPIAYPTTTTYTDSDSLAAGVTYYYVVCAVDKAGNEAPISNWVSEFAGAPPVKGTVWHIPSSTTAVAGGYTYRDPAYEVHKGTRVYFFSKNAVAATQSGLTIYWGQDGTNFASAVAGQFDSNNGGYDFWYATVTITQSGGTTFYYYLAADYSSGADRTYLYDLYSNGISSTSAFVADAVSKPFKLYIRNTAPGAPSLTSPTGGEELFADNTWTITWSTVTDPDGDAVYYDIDYSVDGGVSWNGITGNAQGASYVWTVENTPCDAALMRIRAWDGTDYSDFDESNSTFTITAVTTDHIVISEICIGYGTAAVEYIELYNPTTYQWLLNDGGVKRIRLKTTESTVDNALQVTQKTLTFLNDAIPTKGFFLIASVASVGGVSADCTYGGDLSGADGIQILYDDIIKDKAAWGTTQALPGNIPDCTETTRISELKDVDSNWSMERKAYPNSTAESMAAAYLALDKVAGADNNKGNAVDTDDNSADFVVHKDTHYFTPQNSSSPAEPPANTSAPTLSGGTVTPAKGTSATSFSFSVNYTDLGNDRPTFAKVYIDDDGGHPMGSTDEIYDNGSIHTYTTALSAGPHTYYFYFSDGKYYVRYPASGTLTGPGVGPNLDLIEIIRPDTPADNENRAPGTVTFDCLLSGGGAGDVNGYSSFEARLKYSLNGGVYQTLALTQDSVDETGNYFTASKSFAAGDYVSFYFEGRDSDSALWTAVTHSDESYFTVGLLPGWHYPSTIFKSTAAFPAAYRYPLIPLPTQTVDIFAGCESSTASVFLYYAVNDLPALKADGTAASGSVRIDLKKEFATGAADDDREGNYFTTRVSTNPIPIQNDGDIVYYFIKANLTGYPTTYLITDGNAPEGCHMTSALPSLKTQCFSYKVGEVELIDAFHIASLPDNPSDALWMREVMDDEGSRYFDIHTAHGDRSETINIYFGKNADSTDYAGGAADLTATLYWRQCSPNPESDWHVSTFTYCLTNGSTDYWHCEFVQPSGDSLRFTRDDIVEYYIELIKSGMEDTVLYPGAGDGADPDKDDNSDTIALSIFEKDAQYNNSTQPKFWYKIKNFPPVMSKFDMVPANGEEGFNVTNPLYFSWGDAADYDGDSIVKYYFEICLAANGFNNVLASSETANTTVPVGGVLSNGNRYDWRVRAKDDYGEWGEYINWKFGTLGSARVSWLSMTYGPTGTENVMYDLLDSQRPKRYTDITNNDAVRIQFEIEPSPASTASRARVYYAVSASATDPVVTIADSTNTATNSFFFRVDDFTGDTNGSFGKFNPFPHSVGSTITASITIPADVHHKTDANYFWVKPCALIEGATIWVNGNETRCYAITENTDKIVLGRDPGSKNREFPTDYSTSPPGVGDSNNNDMVDNYTPLWHNPSSALMPGYTTKNYLTPEDNINRVGLDGKTLDVGGAGNYTTSDGADGNMDIYYGEDPGIYMRTAYKDIGSGCSVVMSYNNFASVKTAPLQYSVNLSTEMSPYELQYSFAKALESSDVKNMPENAEIRYYFKLSQGSSGESYLCRSAAGSQVVASEQTARTNAFTYHVLQDDYTRPFVWQKPAPYAVPNDSETLCGRSVGYIMVKVGLGDTADGCITPVGDSKMGPFNTWPGGWVNAVTNGKDPYLEGDAGGTGFDGYAPFNTSAGGDYSEQFDGYFGNNVPAINVSTNTVNSGVVSSGNDNIDYTGAKRWVHQTLCYFAYMADPDECTDAGIRNSRQLFHINNVDGTGATQNIDGDETDSATTISGVAVMAPSDAGANGNCEWYARIPIPPNVEEVPYLYYRIWACNGDADPQARNTERGGGGQTGAGNAGYPSGTGFGNPIDDPYLPEYPTEGGNTLKGGRYRDRDYGWVTRSLFAGRVAKPAQVRITAIVNYKNTRRQVTAFMKIDASSRRPAGIISIQVNTPKMLGE
ncbi:hypothetical protein FP828_08515, partial [bacterium]|nr:hypothetical protein [bacterium]